MQINIGRDKNKEGLVHKKFLKHAKEARKLKNIEVKGLMTILPFGKTKKKTKNFLRRQK